MGDEFFSKPIAKCSALCLLLAGVGVWSSSLKKLKCSFGIGNIRLPNLAVMPGNPIFLFVFSFYASFVFHCI